MTRGINRKEYMRIFAKLVGGFIVMCFVLALSFPAYADSRNPSYLALKGGIYSPQNDKSASVQSCQQYLNFSFDEFTRNKPFHLNTLCTTCTTPGCTTPDTPAWADILLTPENFVACKGAPIALCYYSGPDMPVNSEAAPTPCVLRPDGAIADCTCYEIPPGSTYFVDINAILNLDVCNDTVNTCGPTGSDCLPAGRKVAPVCEAIRKGTLIPGADLISTFSFVLDGPDGPLPIKNELCTTIPTLYAGCMTAPCKRTHVIDDYTGMFLVKCACPTYEGFFQVGADPNRLGCNLGPDNVWSAAYAPNAQTFPELPKCVPDVGGNECPLLPPGFQEGDVPVPSDVSCQKVCSEYKQSNQKGIQVGFTCDATLCTAASDPALWIKACAGLDKHSVSEIIKLETLVGYSCAASQICGCEPNKKTNEEIWRLNAAQRHHKPPIEPQCDYNGTLCGTEP